jgi:invasion protein IalB
MRGVGISPRSVVKGSETPAAGGGWFKGLRLMTSRSVSSRWRACAATAAALAALVSALGAADAAPKTTQKKEAAKPNLVASFGDWNVFVGQAGKGKICYVLAQPKTREPAGLKRESGYAFISDRPSEGVRNEVSFIMGFEVAGGAAAAAKDDKADAKPVKTKAKAEARPKAASAPTATVGDETFDLLPKGANLWVKNAARESALIVQMKAGVTLEVKAAALKGGDTSDSYSLSGFSQAMDRLDKECPRKG